MKYYLYFLTIIFFGLNCRAVESCDAKVEKVLKFAKQSTPLSDQDAYRLAAIIRNQAENIIHTETIGKMNIFSNDDSKLYFSSYVGKKAGTKIDLVFSERASIYAYRVINKKKIKYWCAEYPLLVTTSSKKIHK